MSKEEIIEQLISEAMVECPHCTRLFKPSDEGQDMCDVCERDFLERLAQ